MVSGAKFYEDTVFENTYFDRFILCGILIERRLQDLDSGSEYLWDGETGIFCDKLVVIS
jgi:hypothetical protein